MAKTGKQNKGKKSTLKAKKVQFESGHLAAAEEEHCTVAHEFALTADANDPKNFDLFTIKLSNQPKKKVKRTKQGLLRFFQRRKKKEKNLRSIQL